MTSLPGFVLFGAPRTKKNSSRVVTIPKKGARRCALCGHRPGFPKLLPSEAHEDWFDEAMQQAPGIVSELGRRGVELPLVALVNVRALFYRERDTGDACGFYQALGDWLQAAGILQDDRLIESWDGSRRLKDAADPRIEVWIEVVEERAVTRDLFSEVGQNA